MKTVSMSGSLRGNVGKKDAKTIRREGMVPCVLYGGKEQIHFSVTERSFLNVVFTPEACFINLKIDDRTNNFFLEHNIEDNKFGSFEEAESFFRRMGFIIDKVANIKRSELSSIRYFLKNITIKQLFKIRKAGKIQTTWRLRAIID